MGNIFFVGLMGAGKTTVGRVLAKHLGMNFYDTDHEIERRTGVKIPLIFELEGESGFRKREEGVIKAFTNKKGVVLATGGGAVLSAENRRQLKENGTVIYLRASVNDLWHRTRNDKNRPLLQTKDPKLKLQQLFVERDPFYNEVSDFVVDTGSQPVNQLVAHIEELLQN